MTFVKWIPKRNMFNVFDDVDKMINQAFGDSILNKEITSHMQPLLNVYETGNTIDRKSTRLNSSHSQQSRMPSSA